MNPYDFVLIDREHPPERQKPVWHNVLVPDEAQPARLYSGYLYVYIKAETPLFIRESKRDDRSSLQNPTHPGQHIRNVRGEYIIPGSSLKGMLRTVVETLCNGCITILRNPRGNIPDGFSHCQDNTWLCIACRLFGMMQSDPLRQGQRQIDTFLGKVNIGDAIAFDEDHPALHKPLYTAVLSSPKPHHDAFYLDNQGYIAGRKFYFHHKHLLTVSSLIPTRDGSGYRNQYIQPLAEGADFLACVDFTNLKADEFAALLFAIELQPNMRHKIGYGKPLGLGSIKLSINALQLVDYSQRYKDVHAPRGIKSYRDDELADLFDQQLAPLDPDIATAWQRFSTQPAIGRLYEIWRWPPDTTVKYAYPSRDWFNEHSQAPISATRNLR